MVPPRRVLLAWLIVPALVSHPIVCVVGPTASGKSALAQNIALELDGEVISADSMQVYRGMDIGTGKVLEHERLVAHHGFDLVDPGEPFSAALFQSYARACFTDIDSRGKRSILCGGTGFYVRAAIDDYDFPAGEQVGNAIRDYYNAYAVDHGAHELWKLLEAMDPSSASIIPENDVKRVVRAFELLDAGESYAEQRRKLAELPQLYPAAFIGLDVSPGILRNRIDSRVDAMVESGLVNEVQSLLDAGFREGVTAPQAIGYKEIVASLDGRISLDEAIDQIKTATHRYAKRQRTWFRKDKRISWVKADTLNLDYMTQESLGIVATIDALEGASHDASTELR
ncbi:MAG: tRNA (adenosine(37)-N6)-dimethylallyltransferase MiaA [Eggerthellaceae bacterium]|nr:tRNA (adenosine(37)-N6)-dimethylallyltransferase MiaA [Eggerthellaceae bacterium]